MCTHTYRNRYWHRVLNLLHVYVLRISMQRTTRAGTCLVKGSRFLVQFLPCRATRRYQHCTKYAERDKSTGSRGKHSGQKEPRSYGVLRITYNPVSYPLPTELSRVVLRTFCRATASRSRQRGNTISINPRAFHNRVQVRKDTVLTIGAPHGKSRHSPILVPTWGGSVEDAGSLTE
jgi:hypothetical protein